MYRQVKAYILSNDNDKKDSFFALTATSYALWFKNNGFCQEDDILFMLPSFFDINSFGRVYYVKDDTIKAYFKLDLKSLPPHRSESSNNLETFRSSIVSITLGPRSKQNPGILKAYLNEILRNHGFDSSHIIVKESACSLR